MDFSWVVGMYYIAHKILHTYVVILMPSNNDAYRPSLAVIKYPGQLSKEKSLSKDPKRVQTEVPLIIGTCGPMGWWSSPIHIV